MRKTGRQTNLLDTLFSSEGPIQNNIPAVTSGGNLQCDVIIHMTGPHSASETRSRVKRVLERCEENQITTVSFPAVGTGTGHILILIHPEII